MRHTKLALSFLTVAALAACGGGSDPAPTAAAATPATGTPAAATPAPAPVASTPAPATAASTPAPAPAPVAATPAATAPAPAAAPVPSPTSTPTAALAGTQADAQKAIDEVNAGLAAAQKAAGGAGAPRPLKPNSSSTQKEIGDLTAVATTINCNTLGGTGGSISFDSPNIDASGMIAAGTTYTVSYNSCNLGAGTGTVSGTVKVTYTRFASFTDFSFTVSYSNFTISGIAGLGADAYSGTTSCDIRNSNYSCFYSDGTRNWSSSSSATTVYNNGTSSGTYSANYGSGSVTVSFNNYSATSGTATVRGANGTYTIKRCGANAFTVTWAPTTGTGATYSFGGGCA